MKRIPLIIGRLVRESSQSCEGKLIGAHFRPIGVVGRVSSSLDEIGKGVDEKSSCRSPIAVAICAVCVGGRWHSEGGGL